MKSIIALAAGLVLAAQSTPVFAQPLDGFLKIDGVKGEAVAPGHKKWMQITGISKLPAGCRGDEGGGSLSVRVVRMPDSRTLPALGGEEGAIARFELIDPNGEAINIDLDYVLVSNTYSGSPNHPILVGYTTADGAPTDESDILTLNFKHVSWDRPDCAKRAIASR